MTCGIKEEDFPIRAEDKRIRARVIAILPGQVITKSEVEELGVKNGKFKFVKLFV